MPQEPQEPQEPQGPPRPRPVQEPHGSWEPAAGSSVSVTGSGRASAAPDLVHVRLAASVLRGSVVEALVDSEAAVARVRQALAELGVAGADVATSGLSMQPEH